MKTISESLAAELIDFAPTDETRRMGFGESQLHGTVAAYNMLARNRVAYLADEVGMGKTYVALGVLGLMRHLNPRARVMVIAPRENIQRKWVKELSNFVRKNWLVEDNCVKSLRGAPVREPVVCHRFDEIARSTLINENRDLFLRMTTFSTSVRSADARKRHRKWIREQLPWIDRGLLRVRDDGAFRDAYGRVLNAVVPELDVLIVDEAHNLKHGFGPKVSNRNRLLGLAMGQPQGADEEFPWYGPRVKHLLMLSATPFEYDYRDLHNQLDVFGFADGRVVDADGGDPLRLSVLRNQEAAEEEKREIVKRMLIRRVSYLNIAEKKYSKNMYRREWRRGGYDVFDDPMAMDDPRQRLVVGLIQKKVAEILGDRRFNNQFQIGMLSSFESFLETMKHSKRLAEALKAETEDGEEGEAGVFKVVDQETTATERKGIDTHTLEKVVESHRERFGRSLPHPKLDSTARALATSFDTGEKALVFVRRVTTVAELRSKLNEIFDGWIRRKLEAALPGLRDDLDRIFRKYRREQLGIDELFDEMRDEETAQEQEEEELAYALLDDEGGTDSFFAWFFRGEGPKGLLSGAAFQKNRLASMSSAYSTLFEDDYVSWLLGRPEDPIETLAARANVSRDKLVETLRWIAFGYFRERTRQKEGYPRLYVFESYQVAGLRVLVDAGGDLAERAESILRYRFEVSGDAVGQPPPGFPPPDEFLGLETLFTQLQRRARLREAIWPDDGRGDFIDRFRRREQRRELISALSRLGASYIDLYVEAIRRLGSFGRGTQIDRPDQLLAADFVALLERQMDTPGFHAFYELSHAARSFDLILSVNFPEVHDAPLSSLAEVFGRTLQHQMPVGGMSGGINKRLIRQFRMPGFPLVLPTTDVLQEGEDLHTFCRRVIHYGIAWTPSAMEQRTGRVDRIGSLVQRNLDGRDAAPDEGELIQVYLPHLQDTVEVLQVRRVLERLNRFMRMVHEHVPSEGTAESRIDVAQEVLKAVHDVPRIEGLLESAFPVSARWMEGQQGGEVVTRPDIEAMERHLQEIWRRVVRDLAIREAHSNSPRRCAGTVRIAREKIVTEPERAGQVAREQPFELELRSQEVGDATLIRCVSPVGLLDLDDQDVLDDLYRLQQELSVVKVCAQYDAKHRLCRVTIGGDRLFHIETTQPEEVEQLVTRTVLAADRIENELLRVDDDSQRWHDRPVEVTDA